MCVNKQVNETDNREINGGFSFKTTNCFKMETLKCLSQHCRRVFFSLPSNTIPLNGERLNSLFCDFAVT